MAKVTPNATSSKPGAKAKDAKTKNVKAKDVDTKLVLRTIDQKLGLKREQDLLLHIPLRYEDLTRITPIAELVGGVPAQAVGIVVKNEISARPRRILNVEIEDATGRLGLRFFNFYGSQISQLSIGKRVRVYGEPRGGLFGKEIVHPTYKLVGDDIETPELPATLTPVYSTVAGVSQPAVRKALAAAVEKYIGMIPGESKLWLETVPKELVPAPGGVRLPPLADALRHLHYPAPNADLDAYVNQTSPQWLRLKFDELLAQQLSLHRARQARLLLHADALVDADSGALRGSLVEAFLANLPFKLTKAQTKVWGEIKLDLGRTVPMHRLLQGDVGSGKTVVAALTALQGIQAGYQAALMAPTEILAEQHFRKLSVWLKAIDVKVAWLSGSLKEKEKREVRAQVAAGEFDLLIGTHALIEDSVVFPKLGVAIVDEQHRFGVAQRLALREKYQTGEANAGRMPHQLMMSATPIPRTLAMSYYADLDVSVIDELPPGRTPIVTKLVSEGRRDEVMDRVHAEAEKGRQIYWVCPLIEESETLDLQTALDTHRDLIAALEPLPVGLVHGRLPPAEKAAIMAAFASGELKVLVATTVIEVGVDVPNASLMVIEHAERFGLAQLHQLRGRVGRGTTDSVCVLLYRSPLSAAAKARLKVMYESTDGFEIARQDLEIRGPGEFLGARQSGVAMLRFADLNEDNELLISARGAAQLMLKGDAAIVDAHLDRWLGGAANFLTA
jgi:ATP-dependent DNA helicase RecG